MWISRFYQKLLTRDQSGRARIKADLDSIATLSYENFEDGRIAEILQWEALVVLAGGVHATVSDLIFQNSFDDYSRWLTFILNCLADIFYLRMFFLFRSREIYKKYRAMSLQTFFFSVMTATAGAFWIWLSPSIDKAAILYLVVLLTPAFSYSVRHYLCYGTLAFSTFLIGQIVHKTSAVNVEILRAMDFVFPITILSMASMVAGRRRTLRTLYLALVDLSRERVATLNMAKLSALGEMAGGIAHEINNPLAIIHGKVTQILRVSDRQSLDQDYLKEELGKVVDTTRRIARIIDGLRSFSRDGEKDPFEKISSHKVIKDTLGLCAERFRNNGIEIRVLEGNDFIFWGRFVQIAQVLLNLMSNSFDAVKDLDEKWVEISVGEKGSSIELRVTDSGRGISNEVAQKIMQPFFTTKEVGKGTGLGLSISKGIIEDHGGTLELDRKSVHTSFVVRIPKRI